MIITHPTRRQKYQREYRTLYMHPLKTDDEIRLFYQLQTAFYFAANVVRDRRPLCEHGLPNCPGCHHEQPYRPEFDIEAPAVQ
jgi:hypothetical protein